MEEISSTKATLWLGFKPWYPALKLLPAPWIGLKPLMTGVYGWNELTEFVPAENSRLLPSLLSCGVLIKNFYTLKKIYSNYIVV